MDHIPGTRFTEIQVLPGKNLGLRPGLLLPFPGAGIPVFVVDSFQVAYLVVQVYKIELTVELNGIGVFNGATASGVATVA